MVESMFLPMHWQNILIFVQWISVEGLNVSMLSQYLVLLLWYSLQDQRFVEMHRENVRT